MIQYLNIIIFFLPLLGRSLPSRRRLVLGIESSCDDTGAAVICSRTGRMVGESVDKHVFNTMGGVIPAIAMGKHAEALPRWEHFFEPVRDKTTY